MIEPSHGFTPTRSVAALILGAAAGAGTLVVSNIAVWAFIYRKYGIIDSHVVLLFVGSFILALFVGFIIGGPIWVLLHICRLTRLPVFIGLGVVLSVATFFFAAGHRDRQARSEFILGQVVAGAVAGWVLHRVAYPPNTAREPPPA